MGTDMLISAGATDDVRIGTIGGAITQAGWMWTARHAKCEQLEQEIERLRAKTRPPLVHGTHAIDTDHELFDGLWLESLPVSVLVATIHREHKMRLSWQAKCIVLQAEKAGGGDDM